MLALLNVMRHFESFSQNAKILQWTHVDFGLAAPEIHRESISQRIVFWREVGQDQTCPKLINL